MLKNNCLYRFVVSRQSNGIKGLVFILFLFLITQSVGWSKEAVPVAEDPVLEKRMLALTMDLRCLVCQNESIADSRGHWMSA